MIDIHCGLVVECSWWAEETCLFSHTTSAKLTLTSLPSCSMSRRDVSAFTHNIRKVDTDITAILLNEQKRRVCFHTQHPQSWHWHHCHLAQWAEETCLLSHTTSAKLTLTSLPSCSMSRRDVSAFTHNIRKVDIDITAILLNEQKRCVCFHTQHPQSWHWHHCHLAQWAEETCLLSHTTSAKLTLTSLPSCSMSRRDVSAFTHNIRKVDIDITAILLNEQIVEMCLLSHTTSAKLTLTSLPTWDVQTFENW